MPSNFSSVVQNSDEMVREIRSLVERNTSRWRRLVLLEGLGLAIAAPLGYLWLAFLLDNQFHLAGWGRWLAYAGFLTLLLWGAVKLISRWKQLRLTEDQVALAIEQRTEGGVENRLINALQISRNPQADEMLLSQALVEENYQKLQKIEVQQAARMKPALLHLGLAAAFIAMGGVLWAYMPEYFANAASRILMPYADVDPLYRTVLVVEPGNIEAAGDVILKIKIRGEKPAKLLLKRTIGDQIVSDTLLVPAEGDTVEHTLKNLTQSLNYQVRGGDYTSPIYRIDVARPASLSTVKATLHPPAYTRQPDRSLESAGGDMAALQGTKADVVFVLDQHADSAKLVLHLPDKKQQEVALTAKGAKEFAGTFDFDNLLGYHLITKRGSRPEHATHTYTIRVLADQSPKLEWSGLEKPGDVDFEAVLPVKLSAADDFGLTKVGIFYRKITSDKTLSALEPLQIWEIDQDAGWSKSHDLALSSLGAVEGDRYELTLQAMDNDPAKAGQWTQGPVKMLTLGGDGVALQVLYEQILRTEAEMQAAIRLQQKGVTAAETWTRKLEPESGLRWDDPKNVASLETALKDLAKNQEALRQQISATAKSMVTLAGDLRMSVGLLADTEMLRSVQIIEAVAGKDNPQAKRTQLAEARLTEERIVASLDKMLEMYRGFRTEWELGNITPFLKMLAEREKHLAKLSTERIGQGAQLAASAAKRQTKVKELIGLSHNACRNLAEHLEEKDTILADGFLAASRALKGADLQKPLLAAEPLLASGQWKPASEQQTLAAVQLAKIHDDLKKAQIEAAKKALAGLAEVAKSNLEAQKEIERLQKGSHEKILDMPEDLKLEEIIRMREVAGANKKHDKAKDAKSNDYFLDQKTLDKFQQTEKGPGQDPNILKLASKPSGEASFPKQSDREANKVTPLIQEKFEDLVGKLLEEVEETKKNYETFNMNAAFNINEPGNIAKQAGDLSSTAAASATGNMKPPSANIGGASRTGRQGARSFGLAVGDESINRRGRDKVQEGQENAPDQAGLMKYKKSDDPQSDVSTGTGGKRVDDPENKFSQSNVGKFTEDVLKRLLPPKDKAWIVERIDGKVDAAVSEMLRDFTSQQEQIVERIKAIKKELKNLYLPTEHLDELAQQLKVNLTALQERPDPELFRLQVQTLDKLRGAVKVFHQAHAGFQPSVPREQVIRGRVLDEPMRPTLPGYEEAVKHYYDKLAGR